MPNHVAEVRRALQMLDEYASRIDDLLKQAERAQASVDHDHDIHEPSIQQLGALSRIAWEAHREFRDTGMAAARALDKAAGG